MTTRNVRLILACCKQSISEEGTWLSADQEANDVFLSLLRVQKLLLAARHTAPRVHDGVDVTAYPVLFVIAGAGPVRVSDIATNLHSDVSTVSRQVSALASHGLVAKEADPSDGRAQIASLTDEGRSVLRLIQSTRAQWFQGLLADWDGDAAATFIRAAALPRRRARRAPAGSR